MYIHRTSKKTRWSRKKNVVKNKRRNLSIYVLDNFFGLSTHGTV